MPAEPRRDWKTAAWDWLFQQGVSTVLLFALVIGFWRGLPAAGVFVLDRIETHIDKISAEHSRSVDRITESFDKDQDRDDKVIDALMKRNSFTASDPLIPE